jgi:hypothetical protein
MLYEDRYNIYPHLKGRDKFKPLAPIGFNESEGFLKHGKLEMTYRTYFDLDIGAKTHLSIEEFLDLPTYKAELIISIITRDRIKNKPMMDKLNQQFKDLS